MIKNMPLGDFVKAVREKGGQVYDNLKDDVIFVTNSVNEPIAWFEVNVTEVSQITKEVYDERTTKLSIQPVAQTGLFC